MASNWLGKIIGGTGKAISNIGSQLPTAVKYAINPAFGREQNISENFERIGGMLNPKPVSAASADPNSFQQPQPQVLGTNQSNYSGNSNNYSRPANNELQSSMNQVNQDTADLGSLIDRDYESAMGALSGQEQALRAQAGSAEGQIASDFGKVKTQLGAEQSVKETGVQGELQTAEIEGKTAMQQARDLFRQTQQQNIAQLSGMGISSSSVAEALAETLGVETARRIAGVSQSVSDVRINAGKELGRIKDYYAQKATDLENEVAVEKNKIQVSLMQGLNQINAARNKAASDKASQRQELISNAQQALIQLASKQQEFEQSLQSWAAKKAEALTPLSQSDEYVNNLISQTQRLNTAFQPTQFQFSPSFAYDKYGNVTGKINSTKKEDEDLTGYVGTEKEDWWN